MATVTLEQAWVHLASDLTQNISCWSADWSDTRSVRGEVRTYANGRRRIIRRAGTQRQLGVTLKLLTAEQVDTLAGWAGETVLIRDKRGRKLYCTWFDVTVIDHVDGAHDVTVQAAEVTHSEAV